ncbi:MAG TPA: GrpB family protein [Casimicrobiaceae bacterium]|nr:GrpB family protein [Casimicrobiaceae bacterium]
MASREVRVVAYDPAWAALFAAERSRLLALLPDCVVDVHHIGSTSVPGLAAKPIIDILLEVRSLDEIDAHAQAMAALGYSAKGEYGLPRRRFFTKGGAARTHHVHAYVAGDSNVERHVAFRDYLRAHPSVARDYARLKTAVAASCDNDIDAYCAGKNDFVNRAEIEALKWRATAHSPAH